MNLRIGELLGTNKIEQKAEELQKRLGKGENPEYRMLADNISRALGTYMVARSLKKELEVFDVITEQDAEIKKHNEGVLRNLVEQIRTYEHTYEDLDQEFGAFDNKQIKKIQSMLYVF